MIQSIFRSDYTLISALTT